MQATNRHIDDVIVFTGAGGNVGRRVAEHLLAAGHPVRVVTRTPEKLTPLGARGGDVKTGPATDESPRSYVSELVRTSGTSTPKASTTDE